MAFGLEVRNDTNNVVLDTVYQNLSLAKKQDFSLAANGTVSVSITTGVAPMACINSTGYVGMYSATVSGSTYTWNFKSSEAATGSIYIFDRPHTAHASAFGLKVLEADGVTEMFNSDNYYLRVVDILSVPWSASYVADVGTWCVTGATASNTSLPSAKYAVCLSSPRTNSLRTGQSDFRRIFDGAKTTATGVYVSQQVYLDFVAGGGGSHPGILAASGSGTVPALIVNVEGY